MTPETTTQQLVKYLADAHAIEEQALAQMRRAPKIAGDQSLATIFREHERETEEHERLVRDRLAAHDASPSKLKDAVMKVGGLGFVVFAQLQPDTPGKLTAHAYSYEHLELASYELLTRVARRAGDEATAAVAQRIAAQERAMGDRLAAHFDTAAAASLAEVQPGELRDQAATYLADAHALEEQAIQMLEGAPKILHDAALAAVFERHLAETREHEHLTRARLEALGEGPNRLKDATMRIGAVNWAGFFAAHPDTPGKLVAFAYAFEHLEIAGYELLRRVGERAGDVGTAVVAQRILAEERAAARALADQFEHATDAALQAAR